MPRLTIVVPPGHDAPTGGDLYNAALLAALGDRAAVVAASRLVPGQGVAGTALVDSLCLATARALCAARGSGDRVLVVAHLLPSLDPTADDDARADEVGLLAMLDGVVVTSAFVRRHLVGRGVPAERVIVVPPALPSWARPAPAPHAARPRFLVVGNLSPIKGALELIAALAEQVRPDDDFALDVIGADELDPAYAARCRALAAAPVLAGRVALVGARPPAALAAAYRAADAVVSAATMETYGMALAEARAIGRPLVVLDAGHAAAHVVAGAGVVCRSHGALAAALLALVREPGRLRALADAALAAATDDATDNARPTPSWADAADRLLAGLAALPAAR